ncbi:MAG: serine hydroxymethyltransferase, partial [Planctomycetes bacterium]|nr:serine hydroxymethyltransferase [Planctomycetota bacterium]
QIIKNSQALAEGLVSKGFSLCSGGTDNHLILIDLRPYNKDLTGATAEQWLFDAGIVVNKNMVPYDTRKPIEASGIRIGTAALTTRGLKEPDMGQLADWMDEVLSSQGDAKTVSRIRQETEAMCVQFPVPG